MTEGAVGNVGKKRTRGSPGGSLILKEHSPLSIMKPNRENDQKNRNAGRESRIPVVLKWAVKSS